MNVYPSDVSDSKWAGVSQYLDIERGRGVGLRSVFNGILYLVKAGCQWRFLPKDYPNHNTVYYCFNSWKHRGVSQRMQLDIARLIRKKRQIGRTYCWDNRSSEREIDLGKHRWAYRL